ncbi:MAG: clan AA aspartic protease [Deltaproteobacteria bacterium]|nr:clan AA aspartic protease [Deltaproteobacteria bacterium]
MGYVHAEIELSNPREPGLKSMTARAMVDTGALTLCIPEHVRLQLRLEEAEKREITTADGRKSLVSYVGPVMVRFQNRTAFVGALVLGDEVLLGVVPMEDMDLVVSPARRKLMVNPESPNIPQALVK